MRKKGSSLVVLRIEPRTSSTLVKYSTALQYLQPGLSLPEFSSCPQNIPFRALLSALSRAGSVRGKQLSCCSSVDLGFEWDRK